MLRCVNKSSVHFSLCCVVVMFSFLMLNYEALMSDLSVSLLLCDISSDISLSSCSVSLLSALHHGGPGELHAHSVGPGPGRGRPHSQ